MTYRERPSTVAGATAWTRLADGTDSRILPDGCMDLIWDGATLVAAGPDTGPHLASAPAGTRFSAVRFAPGRGAAVVGTPADGLRDQRVPIDELWGRAEVDATVDRLHREDPVAVLEDVAARRLRGAEPDPLVAEVVRLAGAGRPMAEIADTVGIGERQLHRRSLAAFGYGPKVLARILRLQRALALTRGGTSLAAAAAEAGYADQAHLSREARSLAGASLGELAG